MGIQGLKNISWGYMVIFNGLCQRELSDEELSYVMPSIVKGIGALPHGKPHVHHFQPYQAPVSSHQWIGYEGEFDSDGVSAAQYLIEPQKFPHSRTVIQACDASHFIFNYGNAEPDGRVSASFDLFSCSEFDGGQVIEQICRQFLVERIVWPEKAHQAVFARPL